MDDDGTQYDGDDAEERDTQGVTPGGAEPTGGEGDTESQNAEIPAAD